MCPLTTGETLSSARSGAMDDAVWEEVRAAAVTVGEVTATGFGEALTSTACLPRLRELDARGVRIGISTNGTPLTVGVCAQLAALANLVHVNVSIDSPDPDIYRDIRGSKLDKAIQGLANLLAAIDDRRKVTVSSLLMKASLESLVAFPRVLATMGVRQWILQNSIDYTPRSAADGMLKKAGAAGDVERIRGAAAGAGVEIAFTLPAGWIRSCATNCACLVYHEEAKAASRKTRQCCMPWEIPFIDKDGRVFPCCFAATDPRAVLVNLREGSMASIWSGERYAAFRADLVEGGRRCRRSAGAATGRAGGASCAATRRRRGRGQRTARHRACRRRDARYRTRAVDARVTLAHRHDRPARPEVGALPRHLADESPRGGLRGGHGCTGRAADLSLPGGAPHETKTGRSVPARRRGRGLLPGTRFEMRARRQVVLQGYEAPRWRRASASTSA